MTNRFVSSSEAFRLARARASVAAAMESMALHRAVFDARDAGMSIRRAAAALALRKRTILRHWFSS